MDAIEIRRATEADHEAVSSLRDDVYDGLDYLPCYYKEWLKVHEGYIAEVNGKIVGFRFVAYLDDGESCCTRSGRVSKEFEGKGVFRRLTEHIYSVVKNKSTIKRLISGFSGRGPLQKIDSGEFTIVLKRKFITYRYTRDDAIKFKRAPPENPSVVMLGKEDIIMSFDQKEALYPEGRIVLDWMACQLLPSNINTFWSDRFIAVGTKTSQTSYRFISIGEWATTRIGVRYLLDLYGDIDETLSQHIAIHIEKFLQTQEDVIIFKAFYRNEDKVALLQKVFKERGCQENKQCYKEMFCVEKNIDQMKKCSQETVSKRDLLAVV